MASEILYVPEDHLLEFIDFIRSSLYLVTVSKEIKEALTTWCDEEEAYMKDND